MLRILEGAGMPFPLSYRKEVFWDRELPLDNNLFVERVSEELRRSGLQRVYARGDRVSFGGGTPQPFSRWNVLTALDEGEVELTPGRDKVVISYYLGFGSLVIAASVGIPLLVGFFILMTGSFSLLGAVSLLVGSWLFIMGGNYLLVVLTFSSIIKDVLRGVLEGAEYGRRI
jgi:hypothetical protein